jgi:hypothetical protein
MKKELKLPKPVETYIRAINARDTDAFQSSFAPDAVVKMWDGKFVASLRSKNGPIKRSSRLMSRWTLGSSRA